MLKTRATVPVSGPPETWYSPSLASPELNWRLGLNWQLESINRSCPGIDSHRLVREGYSLLRTLLASRDGTRLDDAVLRVARGGTSVPVLETGAVHPVTGEQVHFITSLAPVFDGQQVVGIQGSSRDVTLLRVVELARQRPLSELASISYMTTQIATARTLRQLLRQVLRSMLDVLGASLGVLVVATPSRRYRIGSPTGPAVRILQAWSAALVGSLDEHEALRVMPPPPELKRAYPAHDLGSAVAVPVRLQGRLVGVMTLACPQDPATVIEHAREIRFAVRHLELLLTHLRDGTPQEIARSQRNARPQREAVLRVFTRAFSRGKLVVMSRDELSAVHARLGLARESSAPVTVSHSLALPRLRRVVEDMAKRAGCCVDQIEDLTLCATEAATNVLVHGGKGEARVHRVDDGLQIWIRDHGRGIDLVALARAALLRTYSSKTSMGLGLNLMLELLDEVTVHSDRFGTMLILKARIRPAVATPMPQAS